MQEWSADVQSKSRIAAVVVLSVLAFLGGLVLSILALVVSPSDRYALAFLVSFLLVLIRRFVWCFAVCGCRNKIFKICDLTSGHDKKTSTNFYSCTTIYPAMFVVCHHFLWIMLGIITEPYWAITILVAFCSFSAVLYFLIDALYKGWEDYCEKKITARQDREIQRAGVNKEKKGKCQVHFEFGMMIVNILLGVVALVCLMILLLIVAQPFLSENLISTIVQNGLTLAGTIWLGLLWHRRGKEPPKSTDKEDEKEEEPPHESNDAMPLIACTSRGS